MNLYSVVLFWEGLKRFETIYLFGRTMSDVLKMVEESSPSAVILSCSLSRFDY